MSNGFRWPWVVEHVAEVLGGRSVLRSRVRTWVDLDRVVRAGLPKQCLQLVARRAVEPGSSANALVYSVVPSATFKRRTRLSPEESERPERLARVVTLAHRLWDEDAETRAFLNRPHPLLDGDTPYSRTRLSRAVPSWYPPSRQ